MMRVHKLQEGEVRLDLGEFLPGGKPWWRSDEVDEIVAAFQDHMPGLISSVIHERQERSQVAYQVLHIALSHGISEKEFRRQVAIVMSYYKNNPRLRREHANRAAS